MNQAAAGLLILAWGCVLFTAVHLEYGGPPTEVASHYLERSREDTGSLNVVAAILADYRLYDTIGEATVLFCAILGVTLILGRNHHRTEQKIKQLDYLYGGEPDGNVYHR
jgi:multisubunit Na+/H+ antiporter MnhB subunit